MSSEVERLREALKSEHHDFVSFVTDPTIFGDDDEMWNEHRRANPDCPVCTLLSSKPDVCVWYLLNNGRRPKLFERDCDHREVKMPLSRPPGTVYVYYDTICAGCGAKIEVRE